MPIFGSIVAFAQEEAQAPAANPVSKFMPIIIMVAMFAILYFIMIRPQKKKEKEKKEMLSAVASGDTIATIGGIVGKVVKVKEDEVTIVTGKLGSNNEQSTLKVRKWAIGEVIKKADKTKFDEPDEIEEESEEEAKTEE